MTRGLGRQQRSSGAVPISGAARNAPTCFPGRCCFTYIFSKLPGWIPSHHFCTQSPEPGERLEVSQLQRRHLCWHGGPTKPLRP